MCLPGGDGCASCVNCVHLHSYLDRWNIHTLEIAESLVWYKRWWSVSNTAADPGSPITELCLPKLPAKLDKLNCHTLRSILVAIAKDLKVDWSGETPYYWPSVIPFVNPENVPTEHKRQVTIKIWVELVYMHRFPLHVIISHYHVYLQSFRYYCTIV